MHNFFALIGVLAHISGFYAENPPVRPVVSAYERFSNQEGVDQSQLGRVLIGELNCTSCHGMNGVEKGWVTSKQAPVLDKVGSRVKPEYMQKFLLDTHGTKPGSTMPSIGLGSNTAQREANALALGHFLAMQGATEGRMFVDAKQIAMGRSLFAQSGCVACHSPRDSKAVEKQLPGSVPMSNLEEKYTVASLTSFLENPHQVRPSGRMPTVLKDRKEAHAVASYLMQNAREAPLAKVLNYEYFEGKWDKLPDFSKLKAVEKGMASGFDVELAKRANDSALRFEGWFKANSAGTYTFHLGSDDGSKLWIDDKLVLENDGIHPHTTVSKNVEIHKGEHKIVVGVFNGGGEYSLSVEIEGRGLARQPLSGLCHPDEKSAEKNEPGKQPENKDVVKRFIPDLELAKKGGDLFLNLGCANCHDLSMNGKKIAGQKKSKDLIKLDGAKGCLAESSSEGIPFYPLDAGQKAAIRSAISALAKKPAAPAPADLVNQSFLSLNCYSCHVRDKIGGSEDSRNASFVTTQPEMGDEGRLPPHLTGVGAKLTDAWLRQVLEAGTKVRPYMLVRMPKFGNGNVQDLIKNLPLADPQVAEEEITFVDPPSKVKSSGRLLVGTKALGCVKCHTFNNQKAEGIQALDLTSMTSRLKHGWFQKYMLNPQPFRPGTRMPAPWPNGMTFFDNILEGSTKKQIEGVYQYLSSGTKAAAPEGLSREAIVLVPEKEPIIYRNFIEGAGPRAIGVGYPEKVNLAFDANNLRLAMIWQGAFIDAGRHWRDRGVGFQPPLGDNVISFPNGPAIASLANEKEIWPANLSRDQIGVFLGYKTDSNQRPTFQYRIGDVTVEDGFVPSKNKDGGFVRQLSLQTKSAPASLFLRIAAVSKLQKVSEKSFVLDNEIKLSLGNGTKALVRDSAGKSELLLPIQFKDGKATLDIEYSW